MVDDNPQADFISTLNAALTRDVSPPLAGFGWVEIVFTPTSPHDGQLWSTSPPSSVGAMRIDVSTSVYTTQLVTSYGFVGQGTQTARLDTRKIFVPRRRSMVYSWSDAYMAGGLDGISDREFQISDFWFAPDVVRPADVTRLLLGKNADGTTYPGLTIHRISYGRERLSGRQRRALARTAGTVPAYVIVAAGDSITEFADGHHLYTNVVMGLGPNAVTIANHGKGGDTVAQLQARLPEILDQAPDAVTVLIGTNDIWNNSHHSTWASIRQTYLDVFARIKASGAKVVVCTIPPLNQAKADITWVGWYSAPAAAQWALANAEIRAGMANVDVVVDLDTVLSTITPGQMDPLLTYDGVHPTAAGSLAIGTAIFEQGYASAVYTPTSDSLPPTGVGQIFSVADNIDDMASEYTVTRFVSGGYLLGRVQPPTQTQILISAVVVPLEGRELLRDPEGRITVEKRTLYTRTELYLSDGGREPDQISIDGFLWEVEKIDNFADLAGFYVVTVHMVGRSR